MTEAMKPECLRFEVQDDCENSIAEFPNLEEAEEHFNEQLRIAQAQGRSGVPIKLVIVLKQGK
jgi:serine/threonine protein kinase HipA of HipAB toxin-antitoxin module